MRALDRRLLRRLRPVRIALGVDVALGLAVTGTLLAQAVLVAAVVATAFGDRDAAATGVLVATLAAVVGIRAVLSGVGDAVGRRAAATVMSQLRRALVARRLSGGAEGPSGELVESGELATAAVAGVDALEIYLARYLPQVVLAVAVPMAVLATAAVVDPTSALVLLVTLPVVPVFLALVGRHAAERARARWAALARLSGHVLDVVRGLATLRAFNRADAQADLVAASGEAYRTATMGVLRLSFLSGAVLDMAATIGTALVAVTVGVRMIAGEVTLPAGLVVLLLTPELYAPLRTLGALFHASTDGLAAAARILDVLEPDGAALDARPASGHNAAVTGERVPGWHRVRLAGVGVRQPGRAAMVPRDLDLDLRRGEVVALVGPSGAGKSTVAAVLLGLRRADAGRVTVDGRDLETLDPAWWRRQVAWLPQRPTMFRGTLHDNIAMGTAEATVGQVQEAARLAGVDRIADELRLGYDTPIGPGGLTLSLGEQRRVGLARALVRDAPLVILDEPTAHLDPDAAAAVTAAIAAIAPGRAVLVIEHHPDLVAAADRVVALPAQASPEPAGDADDSGERDRISVPAGSAP